MQRSSTILVNRSMLSCENIVKSKSILFQLYNEVNEDFDNIISVILFAKQYTLHPTVISPKALKAELSAIRLNPNIQFPVPFSYYNEIYKCFEICEISAVYDSEIIIFAFTILLVHEPMFNLFNLIPLPASQQYLLTYKL